MASLEQRVGQLEGAYNHLATKADLSQMEARLTGDSSQMGTRLTADISRVETRLTADISRVETRLTRDISNLKSDINKVIIGLAGLQLVGLGAVAAIMRFLGT